MEKKYFSRLRKKIKSFFLLLAQRLWITFDLFNRNGLINHAAAGAYGFLFSAAPALLIISFFVNHALVAYPELAEEMFRNTRFLSGVINTGDLFNNFLSTSGPGIAGIISGIAILWTVGLCALSIQRGLGVIFPGSRFKPLRNTAITLGLGFLIILFIFIILVGSKFASDFYNFPAFAFIRPFYSPVMNLPDRIFSIVCLPLMTLAAYHFVPANHPKLKHSIPDMFLCIVFYQIFSVGFAVIISPNRYNLLYGALGRLFLFLINVYFFFIFFFFGAQMIQVLGSSDALLFIRFRAVHFRNHSQTPAINKEQDKTSGQKSLRASPSMIFRNMLFKSVPGPLEKYLQTYKKGENVFSQGSRGQEAYYIISGKAGVYLDEDFRNRIAFTNVAHFFGEMEAGTSERRAASIKAETDLFVMCLPPALFRSILKIDPDTDQNIIKSLSEQLKSLDKQVVN